MCNCCLKLELSVRTKTIQLMEENDMKNELLAMLLTTLMMTSVFSANAIAASSEVEATNGSNFEITATANVTDDV